MTMLEHPAVRGTANGSILRARLCLVLVASVVAIVSFAATVSAQPSPSPSAHAGAEATAAPAPASPSTAAPSAAPATTAVRWEYRTLFVTWDTALLNWVADFSDGTRVEGLDTILNNEGANGWELVAVVPELWTQVVDDAIREDARRLRIFLKKPLG
jgi:hypothetical protein